MNQMISRLSALLGITTAAIRKYEKAGLISFTRNADNNYREYDLLTVGSLVRIRQLRQSGFSLSQIDALLNTLDIHGAQAVLELRKKELNEEIQSRLRLIDMLEQWQRETERIDVGIYEASVPAMHFRPYMSRERLSTDKEELQLAAFWINDMPSTFPCVLFHQEDMQSEKDYPFSVGVCSSQGAACDCEQDALVIPASDCVVFAKLTDQSLNRCIFSEAFEYIRNHRYRISGNPWAKLVWSVGHHHDRQMPQVLYLFHIPVQKSEVISETD